MGSIRRRLLMLGESCHQYPWDSRGLGDALRSCVYLFRAAAMNVACVEPHDPLRIFDPGHAVQRSAGAIEVVVRAAAHGMIRCLPACALWTILILQNTVQDAYLRSKTLSVALTLPAKSSPVYGFRRFLVRRILLGRCDRHYRYQQVARTAGSAPLMSGVAESENNVDVNPAAEQSNRLRSHFRRAQPARSANLMSADIIYSFLTRMPDQVNVGD
jgi:hypothetical protein